MTLERMLFGNSILFFYIKGKVSCQMSEDGKGVDTMKEEVKIWVRELCGTAGAGEEFCSHFIGKLETSPPICKELIYYAENLEFLCEYKIEGYTVVDIMVWQMDHFKAQMDRGKYDMKSNPAKMVLMAFDTFLDMEKQPEGYVSQISGETGTDYPGKF